MVMLSLYGQFITNQLYDAFFSLSLLSFDLLMLAVGAVVTVYGVFAFIYLFVPIQEI